MASSLLSCPCSVAAWSTAGLGDLGGAGEYGMGGLGRSGCERSCGGELAGRCRRAMNIRRWLLGGGDA